MANYYGGYPYGQDPQNPYSTLTVPNPRIQYSQSPQYFNPVIGVAGQASAESYPIAPGNTIVMEDTDPNSGLLFIKYRDAFGNNPVLRIYKRVDEKQNQNDSKPAVSNGIDELRKEVAEMRKALDDLMK